MGATVIWFSSSAISGWDKSNSIAAWKSDLFKQNVRNLNSILKENPQTSFVSMLFALVSLWNLNQLVYVHDLHRLESHRIRSLISKAFLFNQQNETKWFLILRVNFYFQLAERFVRHPNETKVIYVPFQLTSKESDWDPYETKFQIAFSIFPIEILYFGSSSKIMCARNMFRSRLKITRSLLYQRFINRNRIFYLRNSRWWIQCFRCQKKFI